MTHRQCGQQRLVQSANADLCEQGAPAVLGDVLPAEGVEQALRGRTGVYDMKVTNQKSELIAVFRGKSATIKGLLVEET